MELLSQKKQLLFDLLECAFEGGSNYWYGNLEPLMKTSTKNSYPERFYDNIVTNGFQLLDVTTGKIHVVKTDQFEVALKLLQDKFKRHFNDVITENMDAGTGDVFLQLLTFGDVIYG